MHCTTSSSGITCAGLKKCRPRNCSGRSVTAAWWITPSEEVLEANSASCLTIGSSVRHISSFWSRFSVIASITSSQSAKSS